jgi:hypothetical protein
VSEERQLHKGPGMRRLLDTLGQGAPPPAEASRFDQTTPDGLVRLILEPDGTCTVDIDHFGAEAEQGMVRVEAAITDLYNRASAKVRAAVDQPNNP